MTHVKINITESINVPLFPFQNETLLQDTVWCPEF